MGAVCCVEQTAHAGVNNDNSLATIKLPFKVSFRQGTFKDRVYGSILGSFLGSSIGSSTDNSPQVIEAKMMKQVMDMPGGGFHDTAPG